MPFSPAYFINSIDSSLDNSLLGWRTSYEINTDAYFFNIDYSVDYIYVCYTIIDNCPNPDVVYYVLVQNVFYNTNFFDLDFSIKTPSGSSWWT